MELIGGSRSPRPGDGQAVGRGGDVHRNFIYKKWKRWELLTCLTPWNGQFGQGGAIPQNIMQPLL